MVVVAAVVVVAVVVVDEDDHYDLSVAVLCELLGMQLALLHLMHLIRSSGRAHAA